MSLGGIIQQLGFIVEFYEQHFNVLIYHTEPKNLDHETDFTLNIINKCNLNIFWIGTDEPIGFAENELLKSNINLMSSCSKTEVSEININYSNFNNDVPLLGMIVN